MSQTTNENEKKQALSQDFVATLIRLGVHPSECNVITAIAERIGNHFKAYGVTLRGEAVVLGILLAAVRGNAPELAELANRVDEALTPLVKEYYELERRQAATAAVTAIGFDPSRTGKGDSKLN